MSRKVVQISVVHWPESRGYGDGGNVVYALCDDSTIWEQVCNGKGAWERLSSIPQDDAATSTP